MWGRGCGRLSFRWVFLRDCFRCMPHACFACCWCVGLLRDTSMRVTVRRASVAAAAAPFFLHFSALAVFCVLLPSGWLRPLGLLSLSVGALLVYCPLACVCRPCGCNVAVCISLLSRACALPGVHVMCSSRQSPGVCASLSSGASLGEWCNFVNPNSPSEGCPL